MAYNKNGVCKKSKDGIRQHRMTMREDNYGHKFLLCPDCGVWIVRVINLGRAPVHEK